MKKCSQISILFIYIFGLLLVSCSSNNGRDSSIDYTTDNKEYYFAKGADVSWLPQMESSGYIFMDKDGVPKDCLLLLKERGINTVRLRVFVNPTNHKINGHCSKDETVEMAKRAQEMGFRIMIDFHYSDSWADPGHQKKPAEWTNHTVSELSEDVYEHTFDVLNSLKNENVIPEWVQVGNEITNGMLWPEGRTDSDSNWDNLALFLNKGYDAVNAVDTTIKVIVQIDQGNNNGRFRWFFDNLEGRKVKYDVIGASYYPYWLQSDYSVTISDLEYNLKDMVKRYNKEVMVVEIGGNYLEEENTKSMLEAVIKAVRSVPDSKGLGVLYWEPEGAKSWSGYQLSCWRDDGSPSSALDAFK